MASKPTGGWLAKLRRENLPLAVALQGLGLFLLAFLLSAPPSQQEVDDSAAGGWLAEESPARAVSDTLIPADLIPEQLRMPRFPDPSELAKQRQPAPSVQESENSAGPSLDMDSLRVDTVSLRAPQVVQAALLLPDAPDQLAPGTISMRRFGEKGKSGRTGQRGWGGIGGIGVGGEGFGDGPRCHPRRPGVLRNPHDPISGPPPTVSDR